MAAKSKQPKDTLETYTGRNLAWWLRFVQKNIAACSGPVEKNGHSRMTSYDWVGRVVVELFKRGFPTEGPVYDPNMRIAYLTTMVLGAWWARCHHSKAFDPRRPTKLRKQSYNGWRRSLAALIDSFISEEHDPRVFNGIPFYENPFDPKTSNGKYV